MKKMFIASLLIFLMFSFLRVKQCMGNTPDRGRLFIIGTGPAGPQLATLQALDTIKRMDAIVASDDHVKLFEDYVSDKPVLFDPWEGLFEYQGRGMRELSQEERVRFITKRRRLMEERIVLIKKFLIQGENVGLLDNGNPCLFGPSQWYADDFNPEDLVFIPGMGSDAAAMAALGKSVIPAHDARFVLQTSPIFLFDHTMQDQKLLKDITRYPNTTILYMALQMPERMFSILKEFYPPDMPCAVVFWAGYPDRERIVTGTIAGMGRKLAQEEEKYMGLLLIGRFLEGKPYLGAMRPRR